MSKPGARTKPDTTQAEAQPEESQPEESKSEETSRRVTRQSVAGASKSKTTNSTKRKRKRDSSDAESEEASEHFELEEASEYSESEAQEDSESEASDAPKKRRPVIAGGKELKPITSSDSKCNECFAAGAEDRPLYEWTKWDVTLCWPCRKKTLISQQQAKRQFKLSPKALEALPFELVPNPVNKSFRKMKLFFLADVESVFNARKRAKAADENGSEAEPSN